jgi:hypothetical protein
MGNVKTFIRRLKGVGGVKKVFWSASDIDPIVGAKYTA